MDLSASRRSRVSIGFRASTNAEVTNELAKRAESRQANRLSDMQEALKAVPSPRAMAKQMATNKVAMLKQRLDALKAMLLHASPEQAKILARELKSIAKELVGTAKNLGSGGSGGGDDVAPNVAANNSAGESEPANSTDAAPDALAAEAAAANGADPSVVSQDYAEKSGEAHSSDGEKSALPGVSSKSQANGKSAAPDDGDQSLRAALLDAKKLLKEVLGMLKAKLADAGKETKRDLQDIDKSLTEINRALTQGDGFELYTVQGELNAGDVASGVSISVTGGNVNLSV